MAEIDAQRKKVVLLCAAVVCMAAAASGLRRHPLLVDGLMVLQVIALVYAVMEFMKLKRLGR